MTAIADRSLSDRALLGSICRLLHQASSLAWADDGKGPAHYRDQDLGLGVFLAYAEARALLPGDVELSELEREGTAADTRSLLTLLRKAEELVQALPLAEPEWWPARALVVSVRDLIQDARGDGD